MAYPNAPLNIAGTYTAGSQAQGIQASAIDYRQGEQREATRQYEVERQRLTDIGMEIFGDSFKKLGEDIGYLTGGYKLDQAVQMRKLDVAAAVQERLADEAMAAGPLVGFDPGANPDQAIQEVDERSQSSKGRPTPPPGFTQPTGSVAPPPAGAQAAAAPSGGGLLSGVDPSMLGALGRGPGSVVGPGGKLTAADPAAAATKTGATQQLTIGPAAAAPTTTAPAAATAPGLPAAPSRDQDAASNRQAVKDRMAGRPTQPTQRRAPHTNVGATEIFINPTTGGMYARTPRGLAVPISEGTFRNLISLQEANAERHLFNQTADYENSLARWADALTNEQLAANEAMGHALIESHESNGIIDGDLANSLRSAINSGASVETVLKIINSHRSGQYGTSPGAAARSRRDAVKAALDSAAKARGNTSRRKGDEADAALRGADTARSAMDAILADTEAGPDGNWTAGKGVTGRYEDLNPQAKARYDTLNETHNRLSKAAVSARNYQRIYSDSAGVGHTMPTSTSQLQQNGRLAFLDQALIKAGVSGDTPDERLASFGSIRDQTRMDEVISRYVSLGRDVFHDGFGMTKEELDFFTTRYSYAGGIQDMIDSTYGRVASAWQNAAQQTGLPLPSGQQPGAKNMSFLSGIAGQQPGMKPLSSRSGGSQAQPVPTGSTFTNMMNQRLAGVKTAPALDRNNAFWGSTHGQTIDAEILTGLAKNETFEEVVARLVPNGLMDPSVIGAGNMEQVDALLESVLDQQHPGWADLAAPQGSN